MADLKFSILMPVYNGAQVLDETLKSILSQDFLNFEIIICDDNSQDNTSQVIKSFKDKRIKLFEFQSNVGYPKNLARCRQRATGEIIFLMGQDDVLAKGALRKVNGAFLMDDNVGAVTRPYFWFDKNIRQPVRAKKQLNAAKDEFVNISGDYWKIIRVFESLDQLSGLAYRHKFMDTPFHPDIFPCHIYPWVEIWKKHPIVFLKDYTVAVRIESSQSRSLASIYDKSPMQSWIEMLEQVFRQPEFEKLRKYMITEFVAKNYIGLVQIKNYAKYKYVWREVWLLLKYRWRNIFNYQFWFFSMSTILMPRFILRPLTDGYKKYINAKLIDKIKFDY